MIAILYFYGVPGFHRVTFKDGFPVCEKIKTTLIDLKKKNFIAEKSPVIDELNYERNLHD